MPETERTAERALAVLRELRDEVAPESGETDVAELDADLLEQVFRLAWQTQFESDRTAPRRQLRQIVDDAIEAQLLAEA
jgi:hypothetical protein